MLIGWYFVSQENRLMLELGERQNILSVKSITDSIVFPYRQSLAQASKLSGPQIRELVQTEILDHLVREKMRNTELVKLRIFDGSNKAIYSTESPELGAMFAKDDLGWSASNLVEPVSKLSLRKDFKGVNGNATERYILSTSVPVPNRAGNGNFLVIELFADVTGGMESIKKVDTQMIIASVGVLFVLLVVIYLAARRADTVLELEAEVSREAMESSSRLGKILDQSANEIFVFAADTLKFIQVNKGACHNLGYSEDELRSMTPIDIKPEFKETEFRQLVRPLLSGKKNSLLFQTVHKRKDGTTYPVEVRLQLSRIGDTSMFVSIIMDITERRAAEQQINFLAFHDELTHLPNRNLFLDRLQQAIYEADRTEHLVAVLFLDLDRFKTINDSLGHTIGDQVLVQSAKRLNSVLRAGDTISRLGGDEFSIVLSDIQNVRDCTLIAEKLVECMSKPLIIGDRELVVTVSIGITIYPFDNAEIQGLLKNADMAMYHAKEAGRNNYQFYSASMADKASERMGLEMSLRRALNENELVLHYQPILDLNSGEIVGVESLVRWMHPQRGLIGPDNFISIAEETGLIVPLGQWVLRTTCEHAKVLDNMGLVIPKFAVNLSPRQFRDPNLIQGIRSIFKESDFDPKRLELEITENLLMNDIESIQQQLYDLTQLGIELSIDDFGTGYSSLSYLRQLPISNLKIDRSFVRDLPDNADDSAIVSSTISMAHYLGMKTIAEGIETREQLRFLKHAGCDIAQGYLISRPVPLDELSRFIKTSANGAMTKKIASGSI
ncbi:MAG: putative bifunctional diguanylate cyclase/phosphodiesterase [Acidiferrobacterales bacterium]